MLMRRNVKPKPREPGPGPKITAVVLSYNKAWIIQKFLGTLLDQTRVPEQVVIVDDASTDGTPAILRKEFSQWPVIRLPRNRGQSHARNIGARHAKGEYIIFLDGDIEMRPDMIERLEKALDEDRGVSIAYCHYNRVGSRNDDVRSQPWDPDRLKQVNYISMISMIRRKDMPMPPMDEELRRYEDWDLWLRMMKVEKRGVLVDETLFTAYYQSTDLSGNGESADWRYIVEKKHGLV